MDRWGVIEIDAARACVLEWRKPNRRPFFVEEDHRGWLGGVGKGTEWASEGAEQGLFNQSSEDVDITRGASTPNWLLEKD